MKNKKHAHVRILLLILLCVCCFGAVNLCSSNIQREISTQMQTSMESIANQNSSSLRREVDTQFSLLNSLAREYESNLAKTGESAEIFLSRLNPLLNTFDFKRIGFVDAGGTVYTTDKFEQDLSYREFYQNGMQGKPTLTNVMTDTIGSKAEKINVFSVPVYDNDDVVQGVLFLTYRTQKMQELIDFNILNGRGSTCIIDTDGDIILSTQNSALQNEENLYQTLLRLDPKNQKSVETLKNAINSNASGDVLFTVGEQLNVCFSPINLSSEDVHWYILTMVPHTYLTEQTSPVLRDLSQMLVLLFCVLLAAALFFLYSDYSHQKELKRYLYEDPMTHGNNYVAFQEKLNELHQRNGYAVSMDLNNFKLLNDTCGIQKADEVIVAIWNILQSSITRDELAAHTGADRFILYMLAADRAILERRIDYLTEQISSLSATLGVPHLTAVFGVHPVTDFDKIQGDFGKADIAKKHLKGRRDRHCCFYDDLDLTSLAEQQAIEDDFHLALAQERFDIWYQPKFSDSGRTVNGAEALVRLRDVHGVLVPPGKFIPLFEKNGMVSTLDEYVFDHVCRQQRRWLDAGLKIVPVSVNISRASLYYSDIVERYVKILQSYHLSPDAVQLEITESAIVDSKEAMQLAMKFHSQGFKMLVDDFGNGYSSMSILNEMQFDALKIDKSLVDGIGDRGGEILLRHIAALAQELGLSITAEGVETEKQAQFIWQLHCNDIQGYFYSKPLAQQDYEAYLRPANPSPEQTQA